MRSLSRRRSAGRDLPGTARILCGGGSRKRVSDGDGFVALIKMMIGPVIFCTVGIGSMRDLKKIGRVGVKTLV
jgi:Na+/H+-dicarboxylate symporter